MMTIASRFSALFAVASLWLQWVGLASAGSTHHHPLHNDDDNNKQTMCKDRPNVNCGLIVLDGDCDQFTTNGESYGDAVCQVSCGRCGDKLRDTIFTDELCYPFAKQEINVQFTNSVPNEDDWIGIYPVTADPYDLGTPKSWFWQCGDKRHKCKTAVGSVTFPWLPPGTYKAVMSKNRKAAGPYANFGPFASYAESQPFEVARGLQCASRRRAQDTANVGAGVPSFLRGRQQ